MAVRWRVGNSFGWFEGWVSHFDASSKQHEVTYDDGTGVRSYDLRRRPIVMLDDTPEHTHREQQLRVRLADALQCLGVAFTRLGKLKQAADTLTRLVKLLAATPDMTTRFDAAASFVRASMLLARVLQADTSREEVDGPSRIVRAIALLKRCRHVMSKFVQTSAGSDSDDGEASAPVTKPSTSTSTAHGMPLGSGDAQSGATEEESLSPSGQLLEPGVPGSDAANNAVAFPHPHWSRGVGASSYFGVHLVDSLFNPMLYPDVQLSLVATDDVAPLSSESSLVKPTRDASSASRPWRTVETTLVAGYMCCVVLHALARAEALLGHDDAVNQTRVQLALRLEQLLDNDHPLVSRYVKHSMGGGGGSCVTPVWLVLTLCVVFHNRVRKLKKQVQSSMVEEVLQKVANVVDREKYSESTLRRRALRELDAAQFDVEKAASDMIMRLISG